MPTTTTTPSSRRSSGASNSSDGSEIVEQRHDSSSSSLSRNLQLRLHALNLPRSKLLKSPPSSYCVVKFVADPFSKQTKHWGTTETVHKSCHPQYTTPLLLENYESGSECYFLVQVNKGVESTSDDDEDNSDSKTLGSALFEVSDILGTRNNTKVKRLKHGGGCIFAHLEPLLEKDEHHMLFFFQMRAMELLMRGSNASNSHSFWNASGPSTILELAKQQVLTIGNSWIAVYRSSPVYDSYQPTWDEAEIDLAVCCNGDLQCPIRVSVWQQKKGRANRLIGVLETTVLRLMDSCLEDDTDQESEMDFILYKPSSKRTEVGRLRVIQAKLYSSKDRHSERSVEQVQESYALETAASAQTVEHAPAQQTAPAVTFQDYIDSGCEIDLCVAIDFTSSNGNPLQAGTLHYQSSESLNDYEEAITSIGESLAVYSRSKAFPVWGFGAKFGGTVRHVFQCGSTNTAQDVEGILEAYHSVFQSELIMSGPTIIDQVIQAAAVRARNYHQEMILQQKYCVILILTDGTVNNIEETQRKLAVYRELPLTVIIVGIGRADFRVMKSLASENDNATFVAFREHQHNPSSLAEAALSDVPRQIVNYMVRNRIEPK